MHESQEVLSVGPSYVFRDTAEARTPLFEVSHLVLFVLRYGQISQSYVETT
jgi:hypothetical protein